jgi:hypothetical protein
VRALGKTHPNMSYHAEILDGNKSGNGDKTSFKGSVPKDQVCILLNVIDSNNTGKTDVSISYLGLEVNIFPSQDTPSKTRAFYGPGGIIVQSEAEFTVTVKAGNLCSFGYRMESKESTKPTKPIEFKPK